MTNFKDFLEKSKQILKKSAVLGRFCCEHAFFVFIVLTAIIFLAAGAIFYYYAINEQIFGQEAEKEETKINQDLYQRVISIMDEKKRLFGEEVQIDRFLPDPFRQD
jgi:hypothetical protein